MSLDLRSFVLDRPELADLDAAARRLALRELLTDADAPASLAAEASDLIDGYGPLSAPMRDPDVTDILVNGDAEVWIERAGRLELTDIRFHDRDALNAFIERAMASCGARADVSSPIADGRLPNGARVHVILPPLSPCGPVVSIRRFPRDPLTLADLADRGSIAPSQAAFLAEAVRERRTIAVSGATGSGKTTLVNALLGLVPEDERVVVLEETPELRPACAHVVSLVARPPNIEGKGEVTLADLFRASLRMRPDRIVVGEVRGPEALVALDAMSTGHEGSMVTVHARSAGDAVDRFVSLASQGATADAGSLRERFSRAFHVVVHLERTEGERRVAEILEA